MPLSPRYPIADILKQVCAILKLSPERILRRAGLPPDYLADVDRGVSAAQYFRLVEAVDAEAQRPDMPLFLGRAYARGPFSSPLFAFSCGANAVAGLERLQAFKPLIGPITFDLSRDAARFGITLRTVDRAIALPPSFALKELVFFTEAIRIFTAEPVVPLEVAVTRRTGMTDDLVAYFGVEPTLADRPGLALRIEDAERPFISENRALWSTLEPVLRRQLADREAEKPMAVRVRAALLELLPGGLATTDAVSERLNMSKRSLQRRLDSEGETFQSVLGATRSELARHYLSATDMSVEEISYLLAYRDPNSFYRAFHGWTGMTPAEARKAAT